MYLNVFSACLEFPRQEKKNSPEGLRNSLTKMQYFVVNAFTSTPFTGILPRLCLFPSDAARRLRACPSIAVSEVSP